MPDIELVNMLRGVIQEELKPIKQDMHELKQDVQGLKQDVQGLKQDVQGLKQDVQDLKTGQTVIEATVNDLRSTNRRSHKELFSRLNNMWDDIRRLSDQKEKAIR